MPKVATLDSARPLDCLFVRTVRAEHANLNWYLDRGYIHYQNSDGCWIDYEHRLVARLAYDLPDLYHIHHIDGDKLNNRADNLRPVSAAKHARLRKNPDLSVMLICAHCGASFERLLSRARRADSHFCSDACARMARRHALRPDADDLRRLMTDVGNWSELGILFGVSSNAVRKWAKRYDLDLSICDGRRIR